MTDTHKSLEEILFNNLVVEPETSKGQRITAEKVEGFNQHFKASIDPSKYITEVNENG